MKGYVISDKQWRNERNKIVEQYPEAEAHLAFQLSVSFSNNPSVMLLKHIPACTSALSRDMLSIIKLDRKYLWIESCTSFLKRKSE